MKFEQFKSENELKKWLIENKKAENSTQARSWMQEHIPLEKHYQRKIMEFLKKQKGIFFWKSQAGPYQKGGIPDICVVKNGSFIGLEVKRPFLGEPSKLQRKTKEDIEAAGGKVYIVSFVHEVEEKLR